MACFIIIFTITEQLLSRAVSMERTSLMHRNEEGSVSSWWVLDKFLYANADILQL